MPTTLKRQMSAMVAMQQKAVGREGVADEPGRGEVIYRLIAKRSHPTTSEVQYDDEEREWLAAVDGYKRTTGKKFPTYTEMLAIMKSLGYTRDPRGPEPSAS